MSDKPYLHVVDKETGTIAEAGPGEQFVVVTTLDRAKLLAAHIADAHVIMKLRGVEAEEVPAYVQMMFTDPDLLGLIFNGSAPPEKAE